MNGAFRNPTPSEWTRWHYETASAKITKIGTDRKQAVEYVRWHLEEFGFASIEVPPKMVDWVNARFGPIEEITHGLFRFELIESYGRFVLFVYDVDLAHDPVGFALLKTACVNAVASKEILG